MSFISVSFLTQWTWPLTVDDFTSLLQAMKIEFEKLVIVRQTSWEQHLDLLGDFLAEESGIPEQKEENQPMNDSSNLEPSS